LAALDPRWAGGRPRLISNEDIAFVATTATTRPTKMGCPFTRWSLRKLAAYLQILSLDGGGLKGLFSAAVLAEIESDHRVRIAEHIDLIVGTSTGGLIALALGAGLSPADIVSLYFERGPLPTCLPRPVRVGLRHHAVIGRYGQPRVLALAGAARVTVGGRRLVRSK
jgi:hypothetical protein